MSNLALILKIRLNELFQVDATIKNPSKGVKAVALLHNVIMLAGYGLVMWLIYMLAQLMVSYELTAILPITGYIGSSLICLLITILKINQMLSGNEDSEFLLSMPFSSAVQVFAMFIILYVRNLLICIMIELPLALVYTQNIAVAPGFWGTWAYGAIITCLPLSGIAVMVGMFVTLCLVHSPRKNQIMSGISMCFVAGILCVLASLFDRIYLVSSNAIAIDGDSISSALIHEISVNFRFARFYQNGIVANDPFYIILFTFMSILWFAVLLFMHTMAYQTVVTALRSPVSYGSYELTTLSEMSTAKAIMKKEREQFFRSKSQLVYSSVGIFIGIIVPINFMIINTADFARLAPVIPAIVCALVGFSSISYCAVSIEGRRHWILDSSPIDFWEFLKCKCMVDLMLKLPFAVISGALFSVAFKVSAGMFVLNIIIPLIYGVITSVWGIMVDYKCANYGNESEEIVMTQSTSFILAYLPGLVLPIVIGALVYFM